jgi:hypothetical protein
VATKGAPARRARSTLLASTHPRLVAEFDLHLNVGLEFGALKVSSGEPVAWHCSSGHRWVSSPKARSRTQRSRCPVCSPHRRPVETLIECHPQLAAQWDHARNGSLTAAHVSPGSNLAVWWRCDRSADHSWEASVVSRSVLGNGCPMCSGLRATARSSLAAVAPALAAEWDTERNGQLSPGGVTAASGREVWWRCPIVPTHRWKAAVFARARGNGCPFCSGRRVTPERCLLAYPHLVAELEPDNELTASQINAGSHMRAQWRCSRGHRWQAEVVSRTRCGARCPRCTGSQRSMMERAVAGWLAEIAPVNDDDRHIRVGVRTVVVDVAIPSWQLIIEVDGAYWHRSRLDKDIAKNDLLSSAGWQVVRLRMAPLQSIGEHDVVIGAGCPRDWALTLGRRISDLGYPVGLLTTACGDDRVRKRSGEPRTWCEACCSAAHSTSAR